MCCNALSADGRVVALFYGCGAHSDTPAPAGAGSPAYEPYDDGVLEIQTVVQTSVEVLSVTEVTEAPADTEVPAEAESVDAGEPEPAPVAEAEAVAVQDEPVPPAEDEPDPATDD